MHFFFIEDEIDAHRRHRGTGGAGRFILAAMLAQVGQNGPAGTGDADIAQEFPPGMRQLGKWIPMRMGNGCFIGHK